MNTNAVPKSLFGPLGNRLIHAVAHRFSSLRPGKMFAKAQSQTDQSDDFQIQLIGAARLIAATGDHRLISPTEEIDPKRPLRIGFCDNLANNAYNFVKALRRLGHDAELVYQREGIDRYLMNRPFWEDVPVVCNSAEEGEQFEARWTAPEYVRQTVYDEQLQLFYQGRTSAAVEVQELYEQTFGFRLPLDRALLLAQMMGYWTTLVEFARYDVIQLSSAAIQLGPFCPRPYVVFPTGGDIFSLPFEETLFGLLTRAGYRGAAHVLVCETNYPEYLDRIQCAAPRSFAPMMIDTDTYAPGHCNELREQWQSRSGGTKFALSVCRQSWEWKGNDRIIRAFRRFADAGHHDWRLVLQEWGPDIEQSRHLITQLNLQEKTLWQKLCSKPELRRRQQAADLVVDQFVMEGYGTSVLESMAAGKPVLMRSMDGHCDGYFDEPPPFVGAVTEDEIFEGLVQMAEDAARESAGADSLNWLQRYHGYESVAEVYLNAYKAACRGVRRGA